MSDELKILFICSQNRWRSLTAEKMYEGFPGYSVKSAGTEKGARIRVTEGHIGWADIIFVMEKRHTEILRMKFHEELVGKKLVCLHIGDEFGFMSGDLQKLLKTRLSEHIEVPE